MSPVQFSSQFSLPTLHGAHKAGNAKTYFSGALQATHGVDRVTFSGNDEAPPPEPPETKSQGGGLLKKLIKPAIKLTVAAGLAAGAVAAHLIALPSMIAPPIGVAIHVAIAAALGIPAAMLGLSSLKELLGAFKSGKGQGEEAPTETHEHGGDEHTHTEEDAQPASDLETALMPTDTPEPATQTVAINQLGPLLNSFGVEGAKPSEVIRAIKADEALAAKYPGVKDRAYTVAIAVSEDDVQAIAKAVKAQRETSVS